MTSCDVVVVVDHKGDRLGPSLLIPAPGPTPADPTRGPAAPPPPPFGRQGEGVVICSPFREGYPNRAQATTFEAVV